MFAFGCMFSGSASFGQTQDAIQISVAPGGTRYWHASCGNPEVRGLMPTVGAHLEKNGAAFANQRIWVSEARGNLLDYVVLRPPACDRFRETNQLYVETDEHGDAILQLNFRTANLDADPGLGEGYRTLHFAYIDNANPTAIQSVTAEFYLCKGCNDCVFTNGERPATTHEMSEARKHIDWALDDDGPCTQWGIVGGVPCLDWSREVQIGNEVGVVSRANTSARQQILNAMMAIHASDFYITKRDYYRELAFWCVLSTQIHRDGRPTFDWMQSHQAEVLRALEETPIFRTLLDRDWRGMLRDAFPGLSFP